jgi:hypothetical protein
MSIIGLLSRWQLFFSSCFIYQDHNSACVLHCMFITLLINAYSFSPGTCRGVIALNMEDGTLHRFRSANTIIATGVRILLSLLLPV